MNRWQRFQDRITALRAPAGVSLLLCALVFTLFLILTGPTLQLAWIHQQHGMITSFQPLAQDGIGEHHFQAVNLYGWVRYDQRLDLTGENNSVQDRLVVMQDEGSHSAVLIKINHMYAIRDAQMTSVQGVIRRMNRTRQADLLSAYGEEIHALQAQGWQLDSRYYINEYETLPTAATIRSMLIFGAVNLGLILLFAIPFLVPHPRTLGKSVSARHRPTNV